jgi:hypothetical protein
MKKVTNSFGLIFKINYTYIYYNKIPVSLGGECVKIEFTNGSVIEVLESVDVTRGKSSEYILWEMPEEKAETDESQ